jgi:hypothetical protein
MLAAALNPDFGMLALGQDLRDSAGAPELEFEMRLLRENLVNRVARPVLESATRPQAEKRLASGLSEFQRILAALPLQRLTSFGRSLDGQTVVKAASLALDVIDRAIDDSGVSAGNFVALSTYVQLSRAQVRLTEEIHKTRPRIRLGVEATSAMTDALGLKIAAELVFGICLVGATQEIPPRSPTVFTELCTGAEHLAKMQHVRFLRFASLVMPERRPAAVASPKADPKMPIWIATAHQLSVQRAAERLRSLRA